MADTTFVSKVTRLARAWLQDVNDLVYGLPNTADVTKGTSLIGWLRNLTGTIATTLYQLLTWQPPNIKEFGALGDGVTDDTAAFTTAVLNGVPIYVPTSSLFYKVSALSSAGRELLWGPGVVQVAGVVTSIPSLPGTASTALAANTVIKATLAPASNTPNGSVGEGAYNSTVTRTGGFGQFGNWLSQYLVTAAAPAAQFDVGITSWISHTNLTGGAAFGGWDGANTPAKNLSQTFSSGSAIGREINAGNRWADFGLQTDVGGTRYTVGLQLVPDITPALDGVNTVAVAISVASPGVVTLVAHGFAANMGVVFGGAGTLPTGIVAGTTYYVSATGIAANTFQISATIGGASINTTGTSVAPLTVLPSYPGSFALVTGNSLGGHQWWVGTLTRYNTICAGGYAHLDDGGSVLLGAPGWWTKANGYWGMGLDFSGSYFTSAPLNFNFSDTNQYSVTATAGAIASPGNYQGFIVMMMSGTKIKVPYFQA